MTSSAAPPFRLASWQPGILRSSRVSRALSSPPRIQTRGYIRTLYRIMVRSGTSGTDDADPIIEGTSPTDSTQDDPDQNIAPTTAHDPIAVGGARESCRSHVRDKWGYRRVRLRADMRLGFRHAVSFASVSLGACERGRSHRGLEVL